MSDISSNDSISSDGKVEDEFKCDICNASFVSGRSLRVHQKKPPRKCLAFQKKATRKVASGVRDQPQPKEPPKATHFIDRSNKLKLDDLQVREYFKTAKKEIIDRDEGTNLWMYHTSQNLPQHNVYKLLQYSQIETEIVNNAYRESVAQTEQNILAYRQKYGDRTEETAFFNGGTDTDTKHEELCKLRELVMLKLNVIDTLMIKKHPDVLCWGRLEKLFGNDLSNRLTSAYTEPVSEMS